MITFIDTHLHLQDKRYDHDVIAVLERASAIGVIAVIVPGTNLPDSYRAVELAERFSQSPCQVYAAVGLHPTETHKLTNAAIKDLRSLAHHERVVAIGEIGLDYYWPNIKNRSWQCAEPATQRQAFSIQLALASELTLPVIIHNRDADEDTLEMIKVWHNGNPRNKGVLHSYSCGIKRLNQVQMVGLNISIGGRVTYTKAADLREVVKVVPAHTLLLETDGPYLTPVPHRGKRNEPQYVNLVAERIAKERGQTLSDLANLTTQNAVTLFQLKL
jgi:TatD DNase family protein